MPPTTDERLDALNARLAAQGIQLAVLEARLAALDARPVYSRGHARLWRIVRAVCLLYLVPVALYIALYLAMLVASLVRSVW